MARPASPYPGIGENVGRYRRRAGFTQEQLAERADVSVSVIRKLEQGSRDSASLPTLRKLADALQVTTVELFAPAPRLEGRIDEGERDDLFAVRRVLQPAHAVSGELVATLADADMPPSVETLQQSVRELNGYFRDNAYVDAVTALPAVIEYARSAVAGLQGEAQIAAWAQLAEAYQTAALLLIQLRKTDLAYHALGLALDAARRAEDDLVAAAVMCSENWLLTRQARFDEAEQAALTAAEAIEPSFTRSSARHLAVWGWLNLGAAAAATRNNRSDAAEEAMRRARAAAQMASAYAAPEVRHWTTFTPAVVAMRDVELAVVAGDTGRALRSARDVPSDARPIVTYQRFQLDVAAALVDHKQYDRALATLLRLRTTAPVWLRYQQYAKRLTSELLNARARAIPVELRALADFLDLQD